jgi:hypothetical protein
VRRWRRRWPRRSKRWTPARLADLRGAGPPVLALTARRAETLKARAYDGDLARIVPRAAGTGLAVGGGRPGR